MHQLNPAQIHHYRQNGYLVVDGLLTCTEVDAFVAYEAGLDDIGPRGLKNHRDDAQWAQLAHHPNITGVVRQLLASSPRIVQTMYLDKAPRGGTGIALHQDTHYLRNEPNTLMACWIALSDTDPDNGGLCVVPGSNHGGLYDFTKVRDEGEHTSWEKPYPMRDRDGKEWEELMHSFDILGVEEDEIEQLTVAKGSAVFFTGLTVHGSYANHTPDRPRRAFATHYVGEETWLYRCDVQETEPVKCV